MIYDGYLNLQSLFRVQFLVRDPQVYSVCSSVEKYSLLLQVKFTYAAYGRPVLGEGLLQIGPSFFRGWRCSRSGWPC